MPSQPCPTASEKGAASLKVLDAGDCMITALVGHLAAGGVKRLEDVTVILPTQRLCTAFLARLSRQFGACLGPVTWTLEQFVAALTPVDAPPLVHETELILLTRALLASRAMRHVKEKHARELVQFFGEIDEMGEGEAAFAKLKQFWQEDPYHHEHHVGSILDRIEEMEQMYHELHRFLERTGRTTLARLLRGRGAEFAAQLTTGGARAAFRPQSIHVAAFTSLSPALGPILDGLCTRRNVTFWLSASPELYTTVNPIKELTADLIRRGARVTALPSPAAATGRGGGAPARQTLIMRCPSRIDEVEAVMERYEQLVAAGFAPAQIAVLVTHETIYGPILRAAMARRAIRANLAITQPLGETAFGLWIEALAHVVRSGEGLAQVMALAASPVTSHFLAAALAKAPKDGDKGPLFRPEELAVLLLECGSRFQSAQGIDHFIAECADATARLALVILKDALKPLRPPDGGAQPLGVWLQVFSDLCDRFNPLQCIDDEDIALSAAQAWQGFVAALSFVAEHTAMKPDLLDFFNIVDEHLCGCDVRQTGEPLSGLQVLSLAQARYMPFTCAMILGCNEGIFPQALPKDELIDDFLKRQIGLPGWRALEAREDLTFLLLRARLDRLVLTYAVADIDEPLVRSRFVEKLVSEESLFPVCYQGGGEIPPAPPPEDDALWLEGAFPAPPAALLGEFSASSLTSLMHCPYQFLLGRLSLRELAYASPKDQGLKEGILLHQILETFFTGKLGEDSCAEPWPKALTDESFRNYALQRLQRLTARIGGEPFTVTPLYAHLAIEGWPAFVEHLARLYGPDSYDCIAAAQKERDIATLVTLPFAHDALCATRRLAGRIDSVDATPAMALITDYKRSRVPEQKECVEGSAPQLLFYHLALAQQAHERDPADYLLGYYSILAMKWAPRGVGANVRDAARKRGLCSAKTPDIDELYAATWRLWRLRETAILREGRFFADPAECNLCPYAGVCRKEQPLIGERLGRQSLWRRPQKEEGSGA